jgi:dystonin
MNPRFEKMAERVVKYGIFLEEVAVELEKWTQHSNIMENWLNEITDAIELATKMPADEQQARLDKALQTRDAKRPEFEELLRSGKALVGKKDVTDTNQVRDKIKVGSHRLEICSISLKFCVCAQALENQWKEFGASLEEKQKLGKARTEQLNAYEKLRAQVMEWLTYMENRVNQLEPVAIEPESIKKQAEEMKVQLDSGCLSKYFHFGIFLWFGQKRVNNKREGT